MLVHFMAGLLHHTLSTLITRDFIAASIALPHSRASALHFFEIFAGRAPPGIIHWPLPRSIDHSLAGLMPRILACSLFLAIICAPGSAWISVYIIILIWDITTEGATVWVSRFWRADLPRGAVDHSVFPGFRQRFLTR